MPFQLEVIYPQQTNLHMAFTFLLNPWCVQTNGEEVVVARIDLKTFFKCHLMFPLSKASNQSFRFKRKIFFFVVYISSSNMIFSNSLLILSSILGFKNLVNEMCLVTFMMFTNNERYNANHSIISLSSSSKTLHSKRTFQFVSLLSTIESSW